jgi:hypothetical protein
MRRIWKYEYDHANSKWVLRHQEVKSETARHVYVELVGGARARLSKRQVSFSPEEALERWMRSAEAAVKLKRRAITHLQEGLANADMLLELNRKDDENVPTGSGHRDDRSS